VNNVHKFIKYDETRTRSIIRATISIKNKRPPSQKQLLLQKILDLEQLLSKKKEDEQKLLKLIEDEKEKEMKMKLIEIVRDGLASSTGYQFLTSLIEKCASVTIPDNEGKTLLHIAIESVKPRQIIEPLIKKGASVAVADNNGKTPLHIALENYKDYNVVELLIKNGASVAVADNNGKTPLHIALENYKDYNVVELLIRNVASVAVADNNGKTPLHIALENYTCLDVVKLLIKNGASVAVADNNGKTPLHIALENYKDYNVVELLIRNVASATVADNNGKTPLHIALENYACIDVVKLLIRNGASVAVADNNGKTPLHIALEKYKKDSYVVELLIRYGASVTVADNNGKTPLHIALENYPCLDVVTLLIKNGASVTVADNNGKSPLYIAATKNYQCREFRALTENIKEKEKKKILVEEIVKLGDIVTLEYLLRNNFIKIDEFFNEIFLKKRLTLMHFALVHGQVNVMRWLYEEKRFNMNISFPFNQKKGKITHSTVIQPKYDIIYALNNNIQNIDCLKYILNLMCRKCNFDSIIDKCKNLAEFQVIDYMYTKESIPQIFHDSLPFLYRFFLKRSQKTTNQCSCEYRSKYDILFKHAIMKKNYLFLGLLFDSEVEVIYQKNQNDNSSSNINNLILNFPTDILKKLLPALSPISLKELETLAISKKELYEKDMKEISEAAVVSNIGENDFFDAIFHSMTQQDTDSDSESIDFNTELQKESKVNNKLLDVVRCALSEISQAIIHVDLLNFQIFLIDITVYNERKEWIAKTEMRYSFKKYLENKKKETKSNSSIPCKSIKYSPIIQVFETLDINNFIYQFIA
jgi:ankyrin repeat protein